MWLSQGKQPGPNPNFTLPGFTVWRITEADLPKIEEISAVHDFQVGLHNLKVFISLRLSILKLKLYFSQSPECWHAVIDDKNDQIVAFDSYIRVPNVLPPVYHGFVTLKV